MLFFKPEGNVFVGDCMPFFHDGTFRLFYLRDEGHHSSLGGLGGHQWAQASTEDLIHWTHHPLAIAITDEREGSICTGSVFYHKGVYHGFYATRLRDYTQRLSMATSRDGVHFHKSTPNPFASPPAGYSRFHYRDPVVFQDNRDGLFHMLVTAELERPAISGRGGCLAHLVSTDLEHWEPRDPFIIPGLPGQPECPDYFFWNGWYYLLFSNHGVARIRMSREPLGPWLRPRVDALDSPASCVMKTAPFTGGRRVGVAWIGTRDQNKDEGQFQWGGNAVFREIVQHPDGSLGARFLEAVIPFGQVFSDLRIFPLTPDVTVEAGAIRVAARGGLAVAACPGLPGNARICVQVHPQADSACFGLCLRAADTFDSGCDLSFLPHDRIVRLRDQYISAVDGIDQSFVLDVVLKDDIIDVCIDNRRTLINRCPERRGDTLLLYGQTADVVFDHLEIRALP